MSLLPLHRPLLTLPLVVIVPGLREVDVQPPRVGRVRLVRNAHAPARQVKRVVHTVLGREPNVAEVLLTHADRLDLAAFLENLPRDLLGRILGKPTDKNCATAWKSNRFIDIC